MMDLVSREDQFTIGSRASRIVGSKHTLDSFDTKIRDASYVGITRLEVSIC